MVSVFKLWAVVAGLALLVVLAVFANPVQAAGGDTIANRLGTQEVDRIQILRSERRQTSNGWVEIIWYRIVFNVTKERLESLKCGDLANRLSDAQMKNLGDLTGRQIRGLALAHRVLDKDQEGRASFGTLCNLKKAVRRDEVLALLGWLAETGVVGDGLDRALRRAFQPDRVDVSGVRGLIGQLNAAYTLFNDLNPNDPVLEIDLEVKMNTLFGDRSCDLVLTTKSGRKIFVEVKANESAKRPTVNSDQIRKDLALLLTGREIRYLYHPNQRDKLPLVREALRGEWDVVLDSTQAKEWLAKQPVGTKERAKERLARGLKAGLVGTYRVMPFSRSGELVP